MQKITQVIQKWPKDLLLINFQVHTVCNYKCWYCFPGANDGAYRWPDVNVAVENLSHLLEYYRTTLGKTRFQINVLGGEPTLWPELPEFIGRLKDRYGNSVSVMITTNASRTMRWWVDFGKLFDHVLISCHPSFADGDHIVSVADLLYTNRIHVDVGVLMDPLHWDVAVKLVETMRGSKKRWAVAAAPVYHSTFEYTADQKKYVDDYNKRWANPLWFWLVNKEYQYSVAVVDENGNAQKVSRNYIQATDLNYFFGWECNVGIDNITIVPSGDISASCTQTLYQISKKFNLYDPNFVNVFTPKLVPAICSKERCFCEHEYNTSKRVIQLVEKK